MPTLSHAIRSQQETTAAKASNAVKVHNAKLANAISTIKRVSALQTVAAPQHDLATMADATVSCVGMVVNASPDIAKIKRALLPLAAA